MPAAWHRPFSPTILQTRLAEPQLAFITEAAERLLTDEQLAAEYAEASPVLTSVRRRVELPGELLFGPEAVGPAIEEVCTGYLRRVFAELDTSEFASEFDPAGLSAHLTVAWVNSQYAHDFVPTHKHSADLSGVLYLKMPSGLAAERYGGRITFCDGRPQELVREKWTILPAVGDLLVFPGWLSHSVHPFRAEGERRALSFNAMMAYQPPE